MQITGCPGYHPSHLVATVADKVASSHSLMLTSGFSHGQESAPLPLPQQWSQARFWKPANKHRGLGATWATALHRRLNSMSKAWVLWTKRFGLPFTHNAMSRSTFTCCCVTPTPTRESEGTEGTPGSSEWFLGDKGTYVRVKHWSRKRSEIVSQNVEKTEALRANWRSRDLKISCKSTPLPPAWQRCFFNLVLIIILYLEVVLVVIV